MQHTDNLSPWPTIASSRAARCSARAIKCRRCAKMWPHHQAAAPTETACGRRLSTRKDMSLAIFGLSHNTNDLLLGAHSPKTKSGARNAGVWRGVAPLPFKRDQSFEMDAKVDQATPSENAALTLTPLLCGPWASTCASHGTSLNVDGEAPYAALRSLSQHGPRREPEEHLVAVREPKPGRTRWSKSHGLKGCCKRASCERKPTAPENHNGSGDSRELEPLAGVRDYLCRGRHQPIETCMVLPCPDDASRSRPM